MNRRPDHFAGITLTEQQKAALEAIAPAKCRPDSAKATQPGNNRNQNRRDYINNVKNILTPEQYVTFLENIVLEEPAPLPRRMHKGSMQRADGHSGFDKSRRAKDIKATDNDEKSDN